MQVLDSSDFIPLMDSPDFKTTYINRYIATSGLSVLVVPKRSQTFHEKPQQLPVPPKPIKSLPDDYFDNHIRSIQGSLACKRVLVNKIGLRAVYADDIQGLRWWFVISIRYEEYMQGWSGFASAVKDHVRSMYQDELPVMYLVEQEEGEEAEKNDERLSWPSWPKRAYVNGPDASISVTFAIEENECHAPE